MRRGNTHVEMKQPGEWATNGKKKYRHVSGIEVTYDCNKWVWRVNNGPGYKALWAAKEEAERLAAKIPGGGWA